MKLAIVHDNPTCRCGGRTEARDNGTTYCCSEAELEALRALRLAQERTLASELEDASLDVHTRRVLGQLFVQARQARRL